MIKNFFIFSSLLFILGCRTIVYKGSDPIQSIQKKTFILARIDSINKNYVYFNAIKAYTTIEFKALGINDTMLNDGINFYDDLVQNKYNKGEIENKPSSIKKNELYLLNINMYKSNQEKLVIEYVLRPNKIKLSELIELK